MFPPAADAAPPLERCLRVLPHGADTGGFFVAVLRKTRELPAPAAAGYAGAAGRAGCWVAPGGGLPATRGGAGLPPCLCAHPAAARIGCVLAQWPQPRAEPGARHAIASGMRAPAQEGRAGRAARRRARL